MEANRKEIETMLGELLTLDEGDRLKAYPDSEGNPTIGKGHLMTADPKYAGMSNEEMLEVTITAGEETSFFQADLDSAIEWIGQHLPWVAGLGVVRQVVVIDMAFNMRERLLAFQKMLAALQVGDFDTAAREMVRSAWYGEVKGRAVRLHGMMLTGVFSTND